MLDVSKPLREAPCKSRDEDNSLPPAFPKKPRSRSVIFGNQRHLNNSSDLLVNSGKSQHSEPTRLGNKEMLYPWHVRAFPSLNTDLKVGNASRGYLKKCSVSCEANTPAMPCRQCRNPNPQSCFLRVWNELDRTQQQEEMIRTLMSGILDMEDILRSIQAKCPHVHGCNCWWCQGQTLPPILQQTTLLHYRMSPEEEYGSCSTSANESQENSLTNASNLLSTVANDTQQTLSSLNVENRLPQYKRPRGRQPKEASTTMARHRSCSRRPDKTIADLSDDWRKKCPSDDSVSSIRSPSVPVKLTLPPKQPTPPPPESVTSSLHSKPQNCSMLCAFNQDIKNEEKRTTTTQYDTSHLVKVRQASIERSKYDITNATQNHLRLQDRKAPD